MHCKRDPPLSSSEIERPLMVPWVVKSIPHGGPIGYVSSQPVLHNLCNKRRGMCYPVCGMVHIKESLILIRRSSPMAAAGILSD